MKTTIETFRLNAERAKNLGGLNDAISSLMTSALDASDLLRAQIVLTVSALDYFIHEITVRGVLEIFDGKRPSTEAFRKHKVSAGLLLSTASSSRSAFELDIRERHSFLSFQHPDKIAEAVRLFHGRPLWGEVAKLLVKSESEIKTKLRLIVDRRNKIAHEADADPSFPGARWPVTRKDGMDALIAVVEICEAIFIVVNKDTNLL